MNHAFASPIATMEAKVAAAPPTSGSWAYEPKWDGFRAVMWSAPDPHIDSRSQKPLLRYFPELASALTQLPAGTVLDGEIFIRSNDRLDFDRLSERLHPAASRVERLSQENPAEIAAFDCLALRGTDLREAPFDQRRQALLEVIDGLTPPWHLTPSTNDRVTGLEWFERFEAAGCDGIVCKDRTGPYVSGKRAMIKVKHRRQATVVVGGYRLHKDGQGIGSLLFGAYDADGQLHFLGHCANFSEEERAAMLPRFEQLVADASFSGARIPGGPNRWNQNSGDFFAVKPVFVIEVSYDQMTNGRFRHAARFERPMPQTSPQDCTLSQLVRPEGPGVTEMLATRG